MINTIILNLNDQIGKRICAFALYQLSEGTSLKLVITGKKIKLNQHNI